MKATLLCFIGTLAWVAAAISQSLLLPSGGSITYEFTDLVGGNIIAGVSSPFGNLNVRTGLMSPTDGGVMRIEMFETSPSETPIWAQTVHWVYGPETYLFADWGGSAANAWQDGQGAFRVSVLDGSVRLDSFTFEVITPVGGGFATRAGRVVGAGDPLDGVSTINRTVVVPEPSPIALLAVAGALAALTRGHKRIAA